MNKQITTQRELANLLKEHENDSDYDLSAPLLERSEQRDATQVRAMSVTKILGNILIIVLLIIFIFLTLTYNVFIPRAVSDSFSKISNSGLNGVILTSIDHWGLSVNISLKLQLFPTKLDSVDIKVMPSTWKVYSNEWADGKKRLGYQNTPLAIANAAGFGFSVDREVDVELALNISSIDSEFLNNLIKVSTDSKVHFVAHLEGEVVFGVMNNSIKWSPIKVEMEKTVKFDAKSLSRDVKFDVNLDKIFMRDGNSNAKLSATFTNPYSIYMNDLINVMFDVDYMNSKIANSSCHNFLMQSFKNNSVLIDVKLAENSFQRLMGMGRKYFNHEDIPLMFHDIKVKNSKSNQIKWLNKALRGLDFKYIYRRKNM